MRFERHDLLDVAPDAWSEAVRGLDLPEEAAGMVADWSRRDRPVIVRRRLAGEDGDSVPVALQLPNDAGRLRVAFSVPAAAVTRRAPVALAEAAQSAPRRWNATISALLDLGTEFHLPTVYGGLLWQHVTGKSVLRPNSDLDLLWHPAPLYRRALLEALVRLDGDFVRLDGEIVLEDGGAVSWRELRAALEGRASCVAVKTMDGVALRELALILSPEHASC